MYPALFHLFLFLSFSGRFCLRQKIQSQPLLSICLPPKKDLGSRKDATTSSSIVVSPMSFEHLPLFFTFSCYFSIVLEFLLVCVEFCRQQNIGTSYFNCAIKWLLRHYIEIKPSHSNCAITIQLRHHVSTTSNRTK